MSISEQLLKLNADLDAGRISQAEFTSKKQRLLLIERAALTDFEISRREERAKRAMWPVYSNSTRVRLIGVLLVTAGAIGLIGWFSEAEPFSTFLAISAIAGAAMLYFWR